MGRARRPLTSSAPFLMLKRLFMVGHPGFESRRPPTMSGGRDHLVGGLLCGPRALGRLFSALPRRLREAPRGNRRSVFGRARCSRALRPRLGWAWRETVHRRLRPARVRWAVAHRVRLIARLRHFRTDAGSGGSRAPRPRVGAQSAAGGGTIGRGGARLRPAPELGPAYTRKRPTPWSDFVAMPEMGPKSFKILKDSLEGDNAHARLDH